MIIMINQTKANFSHKFIVFVNGLLSYKGTSSPISAVYDNTLTDMSGSLLFRTIVDQSISLSNLLPLKWLWAEKLSKAHIVTNENYEQVGTFQYVEGGSLDPHYAIGYKNYDIKLYRYSKGSKIHILLFHNDEQIGQYNKSNIIEDNLDEYTLYLLDSYGELAPILSLFTIYFDSYNFARRGEYVLYKKEIHWQWTIGVSSDKYNPQWLNDNFGDYIFEG